MSKRKDNTNFEDYKTNVRSKNTSQRKRGAYRESILRLPKKRATSIDDDYEIFEGLPGVVSSSSSDASSSQLLSEALQERLSNKIWLRDWALLVLACVLQSAFTPLMICLTESIIVKMFWTFLCVTSLVIDSTSFF